MEILRNFLKRIYLKYENIFGKNKYFFLFILRKFGQIMTNILRNFEKNMWKNKEELCTFFMKLLSKLP